MKRLLFNTMADNNVTDEYQIAIKKVHLVERNPKPNGLQLLNLYNVGKYQAEDICALAKQIEIADVSLRNKATGKLTLILEQIQFLQEQAHNILKDINESQEIHNAACNFCKIPGNIYHLYERKSGQKYLSMLSPNDWGTNVPHAFLGSYRLEMDQTWTPFDKINEINKKTEWAQQLINSSTNASQPSFLAIKNFEN